MRMLGGAALVCCLICAGCGDDDGDAPRGDGGSRPEPGTDASTDADAQTPGAGPEAGLEPDASVDGPTDAGPDARERVCLTELHCTRDCVYEPRELDPEADCGREDSYVYEGTCGDHRYRSWGDGYVSSVRYYRVDTGELVATLGGSDEGGLCSRRDAFVQIAGDADVVEACEIPEFSPENLCCFTERAEYITFCEPGDAG